MAATPTLRSMMFFIDVTSSDEQFAKSEVIIDRSLLLIQRDKRGPCVLRKSFIHKLCINEEQAAYTAEADQQYQCQGCLLVA